MDGSIVAYAIVMTIFTVPAAIYTLYSVMWGSRARARRRLRSGLARVSEGDIVTLSGEVRSRGNTLVAPLSGDECVVYHARAMGQRRHGPPVEVAIERKLVSFELATGTRDTVLIEGDVADLDLPPSPLIPRAADRELRFLISHGQPRASFPGTIFEETRVACGDRVAIQGLAVVETDLTSTAERGYRDEAPRRVRLVAHPDHPLTIGRPR